MSEPLEPSAIKDFIKRRHAKDLEFYHEQCALNEKLLAAVPACFQFWFGKSSTIHNLVIHGYFVEEVKRHPAYMKSVGFTEIEEFVRHLDDLRAAWKDIVQIKHTWDEPNCVKLVFTAI